MSRIIKTISLCAETEKLAAQKKNFSQWIRSQLLKEVESKINFPIFQYFCESCGWYWNVKSKYVDNFFYCREMFANRCDNQHDLTGELVKNLDDEKIIN